MKSSHRLVQPLVIITDHPQLHLGMGLLEALHEGADAVVQHLALEEAEAQRSGKLPGDGPGLLQRPGEGCPAALHGFQQDGPRRGEGQALSPPEQGDFQFPFQGLDILAHRSSGHIEMLGRLGEAFILRRGKKAFHLRAGHSGTPPLLCLENYIKRAARGQTPYREEAPFPAL